MSIKLKQSTMRLATMLFYFGKFSDAVEWSCFFLIH